jgi:CRP-like cAMP-binding protein/rhodanese-related sulfurtransferase
VIAADHALAERILTLVPINGLDARLQEQALAQGELLEFRRKKTVFEMGARDPYTFYLLDGELELQAEGASPVRMSAGDENARRALAQLQPRRYTAVAMTPVSVFRIERAVLEHILADEQMLEDSSADMDVRELEDDEEEDDSDWMSRLLSSELFTRLPHENIQRFFTELEPLDAPEGEIVVEQGTPGDFLYIVAEGRCAVVRRAPGGGQETQLAVLKEGDTFGEESLISNSPRNASIRMLTDGMLMRLPKPAFEELVSNPTLKAVPWSEASNLAEGGAQWVDVRFADEHTADGIEGSINAPLNALRLQASKLDRDIQYIVYCDSGARSSAGAFLLARLGFDACYLAGGLERSPLAKGTQPAAPAAEPAVAAQKDVAAAASAAFEFEFTSGDDAEDGAEEAEAAQEATIGDDLSKEDSTPLAEPSVDDEQQAAPAAQVAEPAAEEPAPAPPTAASSSHPHPQMAQARAALATLKAERDKAAAYGKKAANAAREFKRRNEELGKVVQGERDRREQLDKELAAAKADSERQASMETSRLTGELEKALKRIESVQAERDQVQQQAVAEVENARTEVEEQKASLGSALQEKAEANAMHVAAEVAFQDSVQATQSEAKAAQDLAAKIAKDLALARERITEFETREKRDADDLLSENSRLKESVTENQIRLDAERERLEAERTQLNAELEQMRTAREAGEARDREARAKLEKQIAQAQSHDEALNQREMGLADSQESAEKQQQQCNETLAGREAELTQSEQALSEEKAKWQETVDKAISDERARLESEQTRFKQVTEALSEERSQAIIEEKIRESSDAHEERETQMRGQVEAHVAKLLVEFDTRLESVRGGYETRLNEQEAMLEDERRRLEAEIVRLREALADARQGPVTAARTAPPISEPAMPLAQPGDAPALDFQLNENAAAAIQDHATKDAASFVPSAADLELDLDSEDVQPAAKAGSADVPADSAPVQAEPEASELDLAIDESELGPTIAAESTKDASSVPLIEIQEEEEAEGAESTDRADEKKARVISTHQLADIRAKMQEKMRAAKAKTS